MVGARDPIAVPPELAQHRSWRPFVAASVEADYQAWYVAQILPVARWTGFLGLAIWIPLPPLWEAFGGEDTRLVQISNWAIVAPMIGIALALSYTRLRTWMAPVCMVSFVVQSLDLVWLFTTFYGATSGVVTLSVVFGAFLPLALRLPLRWTALGVAIITSVSVTLWTRSIRQGDASLAEAWPYLVFLASSVIVVISVAVVTEAALRRQFVAEVTIHQSQRMLQASQRLLRRYAPAAVADRIVSGAAELVDEPRRMRVTALSSDIAGFTALADQIDPESLSQVINEYMAAMSDVVEHEAGVVTEFAGDGLTAVFGAPEPVEPDQQVRQALAAAHAMHHRLGELNRTWFRLGIEHPLQVRIGINTGVLSVGTFGSDGRATYTAIGLQMNVAARIQAECPPGGILLSSSSWHLVNEAVECEPLGEVTVKGVHFPISVYAPTAPSTTPDVN
ncbi:adenylate/guanylate cyclase domain-containing protein [Nocardioides stalactiti]|uniref:adenylate/guanylate cyclase domain-containing protein n=1 Tax=Nocardioides stalactiti TaxID=2755356 RepID=UPI001604335F|nr:adenylate/guanylate cyclase domain-containing protein [Nocardioides stalactiti]